MNTTKLLLGSLLVALSFSACQNNSSTSESNSSMDTAGGNHMDTIASSSGIMEAMDKMMKEMHQMQMTGNSNHDFAEMMHHHHMGAVDMAKAELASGNDEDLKKMAQNIVDKQAAEMQQLEAIVSKHKNGTKDYDPENKNEGAGKAMDENMMQMMEGMNQDSNSSADHQFASMMSKHHQDGVKMANSIIQYATDTDLKSMAQKMIEDQTKEIQQLKSWLSSHKQ